MSFEQAFCILFMFIFAVEAQSIEIPDDEKVNVSIYYESLCPDSVRFITQALASTYAYMAPYVKLRFIPFGKSQISEDNKYVCQHGPRECVRNIIQACALNQIYDQNIQVKFVICAMEHEAIEDYKKCAIINGLVWENVEKCSNGPLSRKLILLAQEETRAMTDGPKFVPTIVYNDVFRFNDTLESLKNPLTVFCKYTKHSPSFCERNKDGLYLPQI